SRSCARTQGCPPSPPAPSPELCATSHRPPGSPGRRNPYSEPRGSGHHTRNGDDPMSQSEQKIVQYLNEAHALEVGLTQVLRSQIAMTPEGSYRSGLEKHLRETQTHADRVKARQGALATAGDPFAAGVAFMEDIAAQTLALWKAPLDLMRGATVEEKVL